jgi:hypothetical protein
LTENTFSFTATTWGIVTGERRGINEPIVNWGLLGDCELCKQQQQIDKYYLSLESFVLYM